MTRRRKILLGLLIPTLAVAAWQWFLRPYEWNPDPAAGCRIEFARLQRDLSYHWLELRLQVTDPEKFAIDADLALETAAGNDRKPAGLSLEGSGIKDLDPGDPALAATEAAAIKFWLEPGDLDGPLALRINGARLQVRDQSAPPDLKDGESKVHRTCRW